MNDDGTDEHYQIRVRGRLGTRWACWFDGWRVVAEDDGTTVISGELVDQAALHGLLQKLRDLGIPLLSLTQSPARPASGEARASAVVVTTPIPPDQHGVTS